MKKWYIYMMLFLLAGVTVACSEEELSDVSVIEEPTGPKNDFDRWLLKNYVDVYNIDFKYRMEDIEADASHNLVPVDMDLAIKLAKLIKHVWLGAYDEVGGVDFTRQNAPKVLHLIGSASWNQGSYTLGTAEGGVKVTLYLGNWVELDNILKLNEYYFKVMHHEFTHVLHQNKSYPMEYELISEGNYEPAGWANRSLKDVAPLGFVTPYAGSEPREDFAELTSVYLTYNEEQWQEIWDYAGEEGKTIIEQKLAIIKQYMKDSWNLDFELLREVISRRSSEINELDFNIKEEE